MTDSLDEKDWNLLLRRIELGKCTPFLGAGVSAGVLPLGSEIAVKWAETYKYPLKDASDLVRVSQFLSVMYDPMYPKEQIIKDLFKSCTPPNFMEKDEPHGVLADLPIPIYLTTNYDDFLVQALKSRGKKPVREICRWNQLVIDHSSIFDLDSAFSPSDSMPLVYHFHGHSEIPESLVLTEDDYLDFLVNISKNENLLPHQIKRALAGTSLLFIGYRLSDWNFRVIFRSLITSTEPSLRRISVTVQLPPSTGATKDIADLERQYLRNYFEKIDVKVFWGTAREFAQQLKARWASFLASASGV